MRKILIISLIFLLGSELFCAAFFNDPLLPDLFFLKIKSITGEKHGRNNALELIFKPYFNLINMKVRLSFKKKSFYNSFRDPTSVQILSLKKNRTKKIRVRYNIDAGYKQKEYSDFFNSITIFVTCEYPVEEVYDYLNQIHPDDSENIWFDLKKKLLRTRDKVYKYKKIYTIVLPTFESFNKEFYPIHYRLHYHMPGDLPYSFMVYMPKQFNLKYRNLITEWNKTIVTLASATERINPFLIKNSVELSKKHKDYIDGLRLEFYLNLFKKDYKRAKYTSDYLLRELKGLYGENFWNSERVGIVINHAVCDFLSGNKKRSITSLENIRVIVNQKRLRHLSKYVLYNLAIFYYFQENTTYAKTLLKRCIRLDGNFSLPKKIISKINE